jgi:phenylalanyl-tRNA synthetase alpha chain
MILHPITWFLRTAIEYFDKYGFEIYQGSEVVDEWTNFDGLNVPDDHPARDVQDTFWLKNEHLLRTHTTSMDLLVMKENKPPVRYLVPGRCYRNETTDASHETTFFQLDGFVIDENIKMGHLIATLEGFFKEVFGNKTNIRARPHHYAFVEPGMDMDVELEDEWREMLGSGMLHPVVLKNMGVDSKKYQGFAFGMGIDRLMMEKFKVDDIRLSYTSDVRFLKQFKK